MARKNSKKSMNIDEISYEYDIEENGFEEEVTGTPVASFSFNSEGLENPIKVNPTTANHPLYKEDIKTAPTHNSDIRHELNTVSTCLPEEHFTPTNNSSPSIDNPTSSTIDNRKGKAAPNGIIPPVNGEAFDIKRTYAFRKSTIRKLNELKAAHDDVNIYLSTILDEAITEYYNQILGKFQITSPSTNT